MRKHLPIIFYGLLYKEVTNATHHYDFLGKRFSFEIDDFSSAKSRIMKDENNEGNRESRSKKSSPREKINHYHGTNKRVDVMLNFIEKNFNDIWDSLIQAYAKNSQKDKSAISDTIKIFKEVFNIHFDLEYNFKQNKKIKKKLIEQLDEAKKDEAEKNKEFNHALNQLIEKEGIDFLCSTFDAFVNSREAKISFGKYIIDFPDEENSENILLKNLFHRYFTPCEVLTLSSFLIKKFVKPALAKKFLNDYVGSNFTKKQGVKYFEKYFLPHSGKLFIGGTMLHAVFVGRQLVKKELNKLGEIEF